MKDKKFDFPKEKGLETYSAIYVPSTQNVDKKISRKQMNSRVREVRNFMTKEFGGTTTDRRVGSYTAKSGRVVGEDVAVVENFSSDSDWKAHDKEVQKFVKEKAKEWEQEAISFEFEAPKKPRRLIFIKPSRKKLKEVS